MRIAFAAVAVVVFAEAFMEFRRQLQFVLIRRLQQRPDAGQILDRHRMGFIDKEFCLFNQRRVQFFHERAAVHFHGDAFLDQHLIIRRDGRLRVFVLVFQHRVARFQRLHVRLQILQIGRRHLGDRDVQKTAAQRLGATHKFLVLRDERHADEIIDEFAGAVDVVAVDQ